MVAVAVAVGVGVDDRDEHDFYYGLVVTTMMILDSTNHIHKAM